MTIRSLAMPADDPRPATTDARAAPTRLPLLAVTARRRLPGFVLDVSFCVPCGLTVLFGPSGAGKSLTLQAVAGLCPLDMARITLGSVTLHDSAAGICLPPQQRRIGYVPQSYALFPHLTVAQNIAFGLHQRGRDVAQRVQELISLMRLDGLERRRPAQLSGGQQQRVALAADPQLLLLDEPFSALDAAVREALREELRDFRERVGMPIVLVTHDAQEVRTLADAVVVLQAGRVLQAGPCASVFCAPRTRAVATLVGMRACWSGKVLDLIPLPDRRVESWRTGREAGASPRPDRTMATIQTAGLRLPALVPTGVTLARGQQVAIGIRADEVRVCCDAPAPDEVSLPMGGPARVPGVIVRDRPQGIFHVVVVRLATGLALEVPVMRRDHRELGLAPGAAVTLEIPVEAIHIFDPAEDTSDVYQ